MKKLIIVLFISICIYSGYRLYNRYNEKIYIQENKIHIQDLVDVKDLENMNKAIIKMGKYYMYIIEPDGTLKVKLNNKWYILRY